MNNDSAIGSLFATISSLSPKYHALLSENTQKVRSVLDQSRRRSHLDEKDVSRIFSLKHNGGCSNPQIARVMKVSDITIYNVLKRKHKLSANWPKHPNEK
jgi:hypothetical protein